MGDQPGRTPEAELGALLKHARERQVPTLSVSEACRRAGVSRTWWQDVERGHRLVGQGHYPPTKVEPATLKDMAHVAGVTEDELRQAGRDDAADLLRDMLLTGGTARPDPEYQQRLDKLDGLDQDDRDFVARLLSEPDWHEAARRLVELGEQRGTWAMSIGVRDARDARHEQRRERDRLLDRITQLVRIVPGR